MPAAADNRAVPQFYDVELGSPRGNTVVWSRLESMRLNKLGIGNRQSTHVGRLTRAISARDNARFDASFDGSDDSSSSVANGEQNNLPGRNLVRGSGTSSVAQSLAPFTTAGKPTCGYYFSRSTMHTKRKFGIPPSDLVKWRCAGQQNQ